MAKVQSIYLPYCLAGIMALLGVLTVVSMWQAPDPVTSEVSGTATAQKKAIKPDTSTPKTVAARLTTSLESVPVVVQVQPLLAQPVPAQPVPAQPVPLQQQPITLVVAEPAAVVSSKPALVISNEEVPTPAKKKSKIIKEVRSPEPVKALPVPQVLNTIPLGLPPVPRTSPLPPDGPRAFSAPTPSPPASVSVPPESSVAKPLKQPEAGPVVVASTGTRAWIKLDDQRTIAIEKGQSLEGFGTLMSVSKGSAKFERGTIAAKSD